MSIDLAAVQPFEAQFNAALADVPQPGPWAVNARCRTLPVAVFFPGRGDPADQAVAVCSQCPVRRQCLDYALPHRELLGVWGGTTAQQRSQLRASAAEPDAAPTPAGRKKPAPPGQLYDTLQRLTAYPGMWARIATYPSSHSGSAVASLLRNGQRTSPPGDWIFEGRIIDGGGSALYAIYQRTLFDNPQPQRHVETVRVTTELL